MPVHIVAACIVCGAILLLMWCMRRVESFPVLWNFPRAVSSPHLSKAGSRHKGPSRLVYADYAGCPPAPASLLRACVEDLDVRIGQGVLRNPHSERGGTYGCGGDARMGRRQMSIGSGAFEISSTTGCVDALREKTLRYCNASSQEYVCVITSGATAGCKLVGEAYFERSIGKYGRNNGEFAFLVDNHTSVVGIQGVSGGLQARGVETVDLFGRVREGSGRARWRRRQGCNLFRASSMDVGNKLRLFAFPSESNFTGTRYPLDVIRHWQARGYRVLLDAAKSCSSHPPDLSRYRPDFVVLSYYKIFGNPTGLGALLIRKDALEELEETTSYFGGGTVEFVVPERGLVRRKRLPHRFEHGTLSYLGVPQALVGFDWLWREAGSAEEIDVKALGVAMALAKRLTGMMHENGRPVCAVYGEWPRIMKEGLRVAEVRAKQGPVVAFNIMDCDGRVIGCREVERAANLRGIVLRSGSLCNAGGLRMALGLSADQMVDIWKTRAAMNGGDALSTLTSTSTCDDGVVLPDGTPTGVVRASFGYGSTVDDAAYMADFVAETFSWVSNPVHSASLSAIGRAPGTHDIVKISKLFIYPIKSCQPQRVPAWEVDTTRSLAYDRHWKVVDEMGITMTVKRCPLMSQLAPTVDLMRGVLRIAMGRAFTEVPLGDGGSREEQEEAMDSCSAWLSDKLSVPCWLVRAAKGASNFSNQSHLLVMYAPSIKQIHTSSGSRETLDEFATRMRPNVILEDVKNHGEGGRVWAEDDWKQLSSASNPKIHATAIKLCTRCDRVCINAKTGLFDSSDAEDKKHRKAKDTKDGNENGHTTVLRAIIAAKKGTARFMTLGVLFDFSPCMLSEGVELLTNRTG